MTSRADDTIQEMSFGSPLDEESKSIDHKGSLNGAETPSIANTLETEKRNHDEDDRTNVIQSEAGANGVAQAEAFTKLLRSSKNGRVMLILLGISLLLSMFAYALDQGLTSSVFSVIAASFFNHHSEIAAITTASR
ncbi:hypothetical protein CBS101457_003401 [Exobasidium rhododendri]|nr:hypothetical protein CBS101457_003401 [Exobasidium rhododendri]